MQNDTELATALFGFNVGVEVGQLVIAAPASPGVPRLRRNELQYRQTRRIACAVVAVLAVYWLYARVAEQLGGA